MNPCYDVIGATYGRSRREDPFIARKIRAALADVRRVLNVGAGAGSYEPADLEVLAVEPSARMIEQRPIGAAPVVQACVEALPLADKCFDATLAVNTIHHWRDVHRGLCEIRRVTLIRTVIFARIPQEGEPLWLTEKYFPALQTDSRMTRLIRQIEDELGSVDYVPMPLPAQCEDGLFSAYWSRPEKYLSAEVRANISNFALADSQDVAKGVDALKADLESGLWDRQYGYLRNLPQLDLGHRLLIATIR